ncbi:MAG: right-handed parallel beta-helix repeat-containing protein, partial [Nanoarchaeota archaeon]|nr:right-handed parallel beta-helix repeat-containing protein [Nanoarchaeota archaeon]
MRKEMIFLMMMLILLPVAITDQASLETTVSNLGPSVDEIDSTDEHLDSGKQIYKTGSDRTAKINTTIIDMNGINQISYVKAFITGPSTIGESPLTLVKIEDISVIKAIYAETFTLGNEDSLGTYTINITVSDGLEEDSDLLSLEYVLTQGKTITVCASGCNFTSIQAAINDSQIGDTIFVHNGSYDFSDGSGADFRDKNNIKLIGESKEGVILEGNYGGSGIIIIENNNIWIEKLTIKYGYQGIFIDDSANITIKEVIVMNSTWEGVRVNVSSDIDILNSEFSFNSDNGVFISESTGMLIDNVKCLNNYWHGFSISELNGIEIRDSEGLNARNQSGFYLYKVSNSNIENVNGRGNNEAGLALQSSTNNHFERIFLNSDKVGVNLVLSSPSNSFSDITILNAATDGIQAWSGSNFNNFTNTLVKGASRGIYIPSGENNKFVNLNATENTYGAYFFTGSGTTTFKDSSIGHNTNTGIYNEFSVSVVLNNTLVMSNPICDLYNGTC